MSDQDTSCTNDTGSLTKHIRYVNINNDTSEDISDSILNEPNADSSHKPRNTRKKKHCKRCHRNKTQQSILLDHFLANEYYNKKKNDTAVKLIQNFKNGEYMYIKLCFFNASYLL